MIPVTSDFIHPHSAAKAPKDIHLSACAGISTENFLGDDDAEGNALSVSFKWLRKSSNWLQMFKASHFSTSLELFHSSYS